MSSGGPRRVRWSLCGRRDVAATSPSDRISLRRNVDGGGESSGSRRGRDETAAALGPRLTVLRPTPNTLSVVTDVAGTSSLSPKSFRVYGKAGFFPPIATVKLGK